MDQGIFGWYKNAINYFYWKNYKLNDKHFFLFSKYYKQLIKNIVERKMFIQLVNVTLSSPVIKFFDQIFCGVFQERVLQKHIIFCPVITSSWLTSVNIYTNKSMYRISNVRTCHHEKVCYCCTVKVLFVCKYFPRQH